MVAPTSIRCDWFEGCEPDWEAMCWLCGERLTSNAFDICLEFVHGHLAVRHPGWWKRHCKHEYEAHMTTLSWCLTCGAKTGEGRPSLVLH